MNNSIIDVALTGDEIDIDACLVSCDSCIDIDMDTSGINMDHRMMKHRDALDQHTIDSITDLNVELNNRPSKRILDIDIWAL